MILALPTTPRLLLDRVVVPTLALFPAPMRDTRAQLMLVATAIQESGLKTRVQIPGGAARGLWQMQENAIADIAANPVAQALYTQVCDALGVPHSPRKLYGRLTNNDELGCALDRLLYSCDPLPLPAVADAKGTWACYLRNQRPGKPAPGRWLDTAYPEALALFQEAA